MKYLKTYEELKDFEIEGTPDDSILKLGDYVRVVKGWDSQDYEDDGETLLWDDTIYKIQRYYKKDFSDVDHEVEILDLRDNGFYVVHESQLEFVPEYEVTGNKYNL